MVGQGFLTRRQRDEVELRPARVLWPHKPSLVGSTRVRGSPDAKQTEARPEATTSRATTAGLEPSGCERLTDGLLTGLCELDLVEHPDVRLPIGLHTVSDAEWSKPCGRNVVPILRERHVRPFLPVTHGRLDL
jgi:hypothetical protein